MSFGRPAIEERLTRFNFVKATYKWVQNHGIEVDILIPKDSKDGARPCMVHFHGGGLITGSSLFSGFISQWILDHALEHSAITVCPNYRLMPEANGLDILEDLADFWKWLYAQLPTLISWASEGDSTVDVEKMLVVGGSAGGYLAIQSALTQPAGKIKAVIAGYPMLDIKSPWFMEPLPNRSYGSTPLTSSIVDYHMLQMKEGDVVSGVDPPARVDLFRAAFQYGRIFFMLGLDKSLFPVEVLESVTSCPPLFIFHGLDDTVVEVKGTKVFQEKFGNVLPNGKIMVKYEPGDHGFESKAALDTPWLREGLDWVTQEWLGGC
ncbi:MAG: hypothetical protein M1838_001058 [Thelocarpon superellum]|nr:MAG: hypothetical protein M1838_001058 [Thelocarpon superellum]